MLVGLAPGQRGHIDEMAGVPEGSPDIPMLTRARLQTDLEAAEADLEPMHFALAYYKDVDSILAASFAFMQTMTQRRLNRFRKQHPKEGTFEGRVFKVPECPTCRSRDHNARPVLPRSGHSKMTRSRACVFSEIWQPGLVRHALDCALRCLPGLRSCLRHSPACCESGAQHFAHSWQGNACLSTV